MTEPTSHPKRDWRPLAFGVIIAALLIVGVLMRLHQLGLPFDRDGYDEGIFWQVLLSVSAGHALYGQTFCSQPPVFIASVYPAFVLFGKTIWAARLGIVIISIFGLVGAALLGNLLAGRKGAIAGLLLILVSPFYLAQSQTLQSDAPSMALSLLAVALAYKWWESADKKSNYIYAFFTGIALSLSIFTKLIGVCALVPIIIFVLMKLLHAFRAKREDRQLRWTVMYSSVIGTLAALGAIAVIFIPFFNSWPQLWRDTFAMYFSLQSVSGTLRDDNFMVMQSVLVTFIALAALYGIATSVMRRDWQVVPILAWLIAIITVLWAKVPLYHHHLLAMIAPLIGLAVLGIKSANREKAFRILNVNVTTATAWILIGVAILTNSRQLFHRYYWEQIHSAVMIKAQQPIIDDLQENVRSNQLIITDAQFLTALADRHTPASLVDTAFGRIEAGTLTSQELITQARRQDVRAILFYSGRLELKQLNEFHVFVHRDFQLIRTYGDGQSLWIKQKEDMYSKSTFTSHR